MGIPVLVSQRNWLRSVLFTCNITMAVERFKLLFRETSAVFAPTGFWGFGVLGFWGFRVGVLGYCL